MAKDTSISIRMDSELKEHAEDIIEQFGLNMTVVVNMLFRQIVREHAIPLSMSLTPSIGSLGDLAVAKAERINGYRGKSLETVIEEMELFVSEAEAKYGKDKV